VADGQRWVLASDGLRRRAAASGVKETRKLEVEAAAARLIELAGRDDDAAVLVVDWERR
jgi:hypothetical protein